MEGSYHRKIVIAIYTLGFGTCRADRYDIKIKEGTTTKQAKEWGEDSGNGEEREDVDEILLRLVTRGDYNEVNYTPLFILPDLEYNLDYDGDNLRNPPCPLKLGI